MDSLVNVSINCAKKCITFTEAGALESGLRRVRDAHRGRELSIRSDQQSSWINANVHFLCFHTWYDIAVVISATHCSCCERPIDSPLVVAQRGMFPEVCVLFTQLRRRTLEHTGT